MTEARVEALGARAMGGVRANLSELTEARVRGDSITRARNAEEVKSTVAALTGAGWQVRIVQIGGVDAGALDQLTQRLTQQINGVPFLQAPAALAHGGAQRTDDDGFMVIHVVFL
mgnify:CR=1 FL=1